MESRSLSGVLVGEVDVPRLVAVAYAEADVLCVLVEGVSCVGAGCEYLGVSVGGGIAHICCLIVVTGTKAELSGKTVFRTKTYCVGCLEIVLDVVVHLLIGGISRIPSVPALVAHFHASVCCVLVVEAHNCLVAYHEGCSHHEFPWRIQSPVVFKVVGIFSSGIGAAGTIHGVVVFGFTVSAAGEVHP